MAITSPLLNNLIKKKISILFNLRDSVISKHYFDIFLSVLYIYKTNNSKLKIKLTQHKKKIPIKKLLLAHHTICLVILIK